MQRPDVFDSTKKYIFHNWRDTEFRHKYGNPDFSYAPNPRFSQERNRELYEEAYKKNGIKEMIVPPGGMVEVQEWLAFLLCKHFVDAALLDDIIKRHGSIKRRDNDGKANEAAEGELLDLNNPSTRDDLEKMTIKLVKADEESPILTSLKEQIRAEVRAELAKEKSEATPVIIDPALVVPDVQPSSAKTAAKKPGRAAKVKEFEGANIG